MNKSIDVFVIPLLLLILFTVCLIKKRTAYDSFAKGAKAALSLCYSVFPFLTAIFLAIQLFRVSGLSSIVAGFLSPVFELIGIPEPLIELILIRPLSGSAGLSLLSEIMSLYGADSYVARAGAVIMSGSETVFYIAAVYFSDTNVKSLRLAIPISILCSVVCAILGCVFLRFM